MMGPRSTLALVILLTVTRFTTAVQICANLCDGDPSRDANNPRTVSTGELSDRQISVLVSDADNVAFGRIAGVPGDEIWIDRSWNGGKSWDDGARLGVSVVPAGSRSAETTVVNIDGNFKDRQIGVVRACGKAADADDVFCTTWTRARAHSSSPAEAAATALMYDYNATANWDTTSWMSAANCLTALLDYMKVSGDKTFLYAIDATFEQNKDAFLGNFRSEIVDDSGWWGLAWIGAYDLTGKEKYLKAAETTCDYMYKYTDDWCKGGIYKFNDDNTFKDTSTNELFIKLAAALHNRLENDTKYLNRAVEIWNWLENGPLINNESLINAGLDIHCRNDEYPTFTYNQGVILGGAVELYKATDDLYYLTRAMQIADAATTHPDLNRDGILHETCDFNDGHNYCWDDASSFKGAFARNSGEFNEALEGRPYTDYIKKNADAIYKHRNSIDRYGLHYEGPYEFASVASHQSALDMLTAALRF